MSLAPNAKSSGRNRVCSFFALLLIPSLTFSSMAIPPDAGYIVFDAVTASKNSGGMGGTDLLSLMKIGTSDLSSTIATALFAGSGNKNNKKSGRVNFDRIVIRPGNTTVLQGQMVDFTATAFRGSETVSGINFRWSISAAANNQPSRPIGNGQFRATKPGRYIVKASAESLSAETEITVVANPGNGVMRLLQKRNSDLTDAERQQIARWRATGALTSRDISSRNTYSITAERTLGRIDKQKRDKATKESEAVLKAATKSEIKQKNTGKEGDLGISTNERRRGGPSADNGAEEDRRTAAPAKPTTPMFWSADPLGWDSGNWATADDVVNWVGRPRGGAPHRGAGNGNYNLTTPAISLEGRGINIDLNLEYNSRLWSKSGTMMTYNADAGFPAPGWNLGFGRMYYTGSTGGCMDVAPDGTRRSYDGSNTVYTSGGVYNHLFTGYSTDGSLIDYSCGYQAWNGYQSLWGYASLANGTTITYGAPTTNYDQIFPTKIQDAHGNYINISYVNDHGPEIDTITDTLGRTITFNYESGRLISITAPGYNGTTRTYVRLHYAQQTLSYGFDSGLTTSVANGTPYQLDAIYYPDTNTGYWFGETDSYSSYGMIAKVISQRGMGWTGSSGTQGTVTAGTNNRQEVYNFPMTSTSTLTDAPGYSSHTETWDGIDTSAAVTYYTVTNPSGSQVITLTKPDGSKNKQSSYLNPGNYTDGMFFQNETLDPSNNVLDKTKMYLASGAYGSSRVTSIERTDEKNQMTKTEFTYGSNYNQVTAQKEYDYGPTLYREKRFTYENGTIYTTRHIFSLVKTVEDYDNSNNRLTRTEYIYDTGTLGDADGVVQHFYTHDPYTSVLTNGACLTFNHPECTFEGQTIYIGEEMLAFYCECEEYQQVSAYDWTTMYRGNLTSVTNYETVDNSTASGAITQTYTYDMTGNQLTASTSCCQQISSTYSTATQYSKPDSVTKGSSDPYSSHRITQSATYDANTKVPITTTDFNGLATTITYDAVARPTLVTLHSGGKTTITYGDSTLSRTELVQKSDNTTVSNSTTYFNGRGQTNKTSYQAGASNYNATQIKYDVMGRQWKVSMPYDTGSSPSYWSENTYDYLSRVTQTTAPDGSTSTMAYNTGSAPSSAASNTGHTVLSADAWGRQRWARTDAFGRLVEVVEPNPAETTAAVSASGNLATSYAYDYGDELVTITQGSQTRSFAYDSLGRLTRQKLAEQTATINDAGTYVGSGGTGANWSDAFVYDTRSNITQRTDARGVKTNISYDISSNPDPLNRIQGISYDTSTADTTYTINSAPAVTFEYMTTGDKTRVKKVITSGVVTEENAFDSEGRISFYEMKLDSRASFPFKTDYTYDTAHRLTQIEYPKAYGMTGDPRKAVVPSYDQASRLTQLSVDSTTYLGDISYNTASQVTQLKTGAGTSNPRVEAYTYDAQTGLLTGQTVKNTAATSTYLDLSYTYARGNSFGSASGKTGQMTKIVDNLDKNRNKVYEFDSLGRILTAKGGIAAGATGKGVVADWTQTYSYDRYGNKTGVTATGITQDSNAVPADGLTSVTASTSTNRITTSGWEYDLTGNLIRGQNVSGVWQKFEYDAAGRLKKVKDDSNNVLETFTYGATREKLMVETSTQRTYYAWGGQSIVAEYTEATASSTPAYNKSYIYAGSRLLMTATMVNATTETKEFHHPNRLGTELVTDGGAGTSYRQTTLPFGTALAAESTGNSNQVFTSYDRSATTGLDYAVNRTYSQGQSRFTQVDPLGARASSLSNPQSNNLYAYTQNMPTDFVDPSGLNEEPPIRIHTWTWGWWDSWWDNYWGANNGGNFNWLYDPVYWGGYDSGGGGGGGINAVADPNKLRNALDFCLRTMYGVSLTSFRAAKKGQNGSVTVNLLDSSMTTPHGTAGFGVVTDVTSYNSKQGRSRVNEIRTGMGLPSLPANATLFGFTDPNSPLINFAINDTNNSAEIVKTQIHELGHSIFFYVGNLLGHDFSGDKAGQKLQDCVTGLGGFD